jgi:hypothetical protein
MEAALLCPHLCKIDVEVANPIALELLPHRSAPVHIRRS